MLTTVEHAPMVKGRSRTLWQQRLHRSQIGNMRNIVCHLSVLTTVYDIHESVFWLASPTTCRWLASPATCCCHSPTIMLNRLTVGKAVARRSHLRHFRWQCQNDAWAMRDELMSSELSITLANTSDRKAKLQWATYDYENAWSNTS